MVVRLTSTLGFEPAIMTEPSGRRIAEEWYKRGMLEVDKPCELHRDPLGAAGL